MPDARLGIKVPRSQGEHFRRILVDLGAFDRTCKISSDESHVYLPVLEMNEPAKAGLSLAADLAGADIEWVEKNFEPEERYPSPEEILGFRPSFEIVGDIAIVEPERADAVAEVLLSTCKPVRTVIAPVSDVEGEFRTRRFKHVAGERRTVTLHREHGLRYRVDLEKAYFTPRLGTERLRIARLVQPGEVVLDMFAGVGPFSLLLAKKGARVIAMDKNPTAVSLLQENARINKVEEIEIMEGDAAILALRCENKADHVIMNLPQKASQFLVPAMRAIRSGGIVHYYAIAPEDDLYMDESLIKRAAEDQGASAEILNRGVVRSYAPRRYNVVMDFLVKKQASGSSVLSQHHGKI
ncbi:MAG TPA: class I SAM-dependent methyltransferase family protein [Methanothrix sp.]|nr:class I SAM-dependent methyltransferase family protein [Methanothrix sp.]